MAYTKKEAFDKSDAKGGMRNRRPRKKVCAFCEEKAEFIDYKDVYAWFTSRAEAAVYRLSATADDLLTALLTYQQTR